MSHVTRAFQPESKGNFLVETCLAACTWQLFLILKRREMERKAWICCRWNNYCGHSFPFIAAPFKNIFAMYGREWCGCIGIVWNKIGACIQSIQVHCVVGENLYEHNTSTKNRNQAWLSLGLHIILFLNIERQSFLCYTIPLQYIK